MKRLLQKCVSMTAAGVISGLLLMRLEGLILFLQECS